MSEEVLETCLPTPACTTEQQQEVLQALLNKYAEHRGIGQDAKWTVITREYNLRVPEEAHKSEAALKRATKESPKFIETIGSVAQCANGNFTRIPFSRLDGYDDNVMINLEYSGLRLVYTSPNRRAPIFEIPGFLTIEECESLRAKMVFAFQTSGTGFGTSVRTSKEVIVDKAESPSIHKKLAELTGRTIELMEPLKLIKYSEGGKFDLHLDGLPRKEGGVYSEGQDGKSVKYGTDVPSHCNREITVFFYLNSVKQGGRTTFHNSGYKDEESLAKSEVYSVEPELGKAVLFFPTSQPPSGKLKPALPGGSEVQLGDTRFTEDMWHRGCPAIDPKEIVACWIWPIGSGIVGRRIKDARATDGKVI